MLAQANEAPWWLVVLLPLAGTIVGAGTSIWSTHLSNRHGSKQAGLEREAAERSARATLQRETALALLDGPLPEFWQAVGDRVTALAVSDATPMVGIAAAMSPVNAKWNDAYRLVVRITDPPTRDALAGFHTTCMTLLTFVAGQPNPPNVGWADRYGKARTSYLEVMEHLGRIAAS